MRVRSQIIYFGWSLSCDLWGTQQLGWTTFSSPGTIEVRCRADYQDVDLSPLGIFDSPLIATRVGSITEAP